MIALLTSRLGRYVLAAVAVFGVLAGAYLLGARSARHAAEIERLERVQETRDILERLEDETRNLDDGDLADRISR